MGPALEQRDEEKWKLLGFFSQKCSPPQIKYSAYARELTAIYEFKIVTNHKPLVYAFMQR